MIKITNLNVKNFKSLNDSTVDEFGDINLFYGFNNSGKSNIFKFLDLLFTKKKLIEKYEIDDEFSTDKITLKDFWNGDIYNVPFIFSNNNKKKPIEFDVTLQISNDLISQDSFKELTKANYATGETSLIRVCGKIHSKNISDATIICDKAFINTLEFYRSEDFIETYFDDQNPLLTQTIAESILNIFNNCVEFIDTDRNFVNETFNDGITELNAKDFKNWLFNLNMDSEKNNTFIGLANFLSKFEFSGSALERLESNVKSFPFGEFTNIGFTKLGSEIEIMLHNEKQRLPLKSFGTGIQQIFYILTRIFMNNSRIVILEELELNLSPLIQKELLTNLKNLLGKTYDQLIFSSHSPFFTKKDHVMVDVIHLVRINDSSDTTVLSLGKDSLIYDEEKGETNISFHYSEL